MADIEINALPAGSTPLNASRVPVDEFNGTDYVTKYYTVAQFLSLLNTIYSGDGTLAGDRVVNGGGNKLYFTNLDNLLIQVNSAGVAGQPSIKIVGYGTLSTETILQIENHLGSVVAQFFGNGYARIDGGIGVGGTTTNKISSIANSLTNSAYYGEQQGNGGVAFFNNVGGGEGLRVLSNSVSCFLQTTSASGESLRSDGAIYIASLGGLSTRLASAVLQVDSTTQGVLIPRMTSVQRLAITSPANGLHVYDTTLGLPMFYQGGLWRSSQNNTATALQDTTSITTTSTTPVLMTGMQFINVPAGTYHIDFNGQFSSGTANTNTSIGIYLNNVLIPHALSQQGMGAINTPNQIYVHSENTLTGASNTIEIRWNTTSGTLTSARKSFRIRRVI